MAPFQSSAIAADAVQGSNIAPGAMTNTHVAEELSRLLPPQRSCRRRSRTGPGFRWGKVLPGRHGLAAAVPTFWNQNSTRSISTRVGWVSSQPAGRGRFSIVGSPNWTSSGWKGAIELDNLSAIGWQQNNNGQRCWYRTYERRLFFLPHRPVIPALPTRRPATICFSTIAA